MQVRVSDWQHRLMEEIEKSRMVQLADGTVAFNPFYDAIQYSSVYENNNPGYFYGRGRLDSPQAWSARDNTSEQWFQVHVFVVFMEFILMLPRF